MANRKFSTIPDTAVLGDLVGTQFTAFDDLAVNKTKKVTLAILRRAILAGGTGHTQTDPLAAGAASLVSLAVSGATNSFGTDATGADAAAASDVTFRGPIGTGLGTPRALTFDVAQQGTTGSTPQVRATALTLKEIANATSREIVLWNPSGPVVGGLPSDTSASLFASVDGGRFRNVVRVLRAANNANLVGSRVNGSLDTPTGILSTEAFLALTGEGYDGTGLVSGAVLQAVARENFSGSARGSRWLFSASDVGTTTPKTLFDVQGGGTNIAEFVARQNTFRFVPSTTGFAFRDSANAVDTFSLNAAGTTALFPVVSAFVVAADPGGSELVRLGGGLRVASGVTFLSTLSLLNDLIMIPVSTVAEIRTNTTDDSDTASLGLTPGSALSNTRGGLVILYGNEHGTAPGRLLLSSGNISTADWVAQIRGTNFLSVTRPASTNLIAFSGAVTFSAGIDVTGNTDADTYSVAGTAGVDYSGLTAGITNITITKGLVTAVS